MRYTFRRGILAISLTALLGGVGWAQPSVTEVKPAIGPLYTDPNALEWAPVEGVPGAQWKRLRTDPRTGAVTALVRFPAGHVESAHHHTHGHTVIMLSGTKEVENTTQGQVYHLADGALLYTPAGDSHIVRYLTDCTFLFITDGPFDVVWDETPKEGA